MSFLQFGSGSSDQRRSLADCIGYAFRIELVLCEEVQSGHGGDHFGETGDFPHFVNAFAVVVGIPVVLALPNTPTLGRYLRHALILTKQPQEISEVFHTVLTVPTGAPLGLHRVAVLPPPPEYRPRIPSHPRLRGHLDWYGLLVLLSDETANGSGVLYALGGLSDGHDLLEGGVGGRKGYFEGRPDESLLGFDDEGQRLLDLLPSLHLLALRFAGPVLADLVAIGEVDIGAP